MRVGDSLSVRAMKIAILETGRVPDQMLDTHGDYPSMFTRILGDAVSSDVTFSPVAVIDGVFPDAPSDFDGYVITGSKFGIYDDEPWIPPLLEFIRETAKDNIRQVGICFGHQAMAEAFGGKVIKSQMGWGCGIHGYEILETRPWMDPPGERTSVAVMHQDQVTEIPQGAKILGGSEFCPFGILEYAQGPAISFQCHPEFGKQYSADLIDFRRGDRIPEQIADIGLASLRRDLNSPVVSRWIMNYLTA